MLIPEELILRCHTFAVAILVAIALAETEGSCYVYFSRNDDLQSGICLSSSLASYSTKAGSVNTTADTKQSN